MAVGGNGIGGRRRVIKQLSYPLVFSDVVRQQRHLPGLPCEGSALVVGRSGCSFYRPGGSRVVSVGKLNRKSWVNY